jgi:electron transport complex protein RnfC
MSVVILNDGKDTPYDGAISYKEKASDPKALADIIREAGIVGMGGAAFPTHFKISSGIGKADTIIITARNASRL